MSELDLNIRTTRLLCDTDIILRKALSESDIEEPATAFFLTSLVAHTFKDGLHIDETELSELWWHWSKLAEEFAGSDDRVANVTEKLLDHGIVKETGENYLIDITRLPDGICALFFALQIRGLATSSNIRDYIVGLLELRNRAESEMADENDDYDDDDYDDDDHDGDTTTTKSIGTDC